MTLSYEQIRENLEALEKSQTEEVNKLQESELLLKQQLELVEKLLLKQQLELVQTKQELTQERQHNSEITSKLTELEQDSQSLTLKRVPSWEEIAKNKYPSMADDLVNAPCPKKRLKICIVTQDIFGPIRNGGIGTAFYQLANLLAEFGHDVTVLYSLGNRCENGTIDDWIDYYAKRNINFIPLPEPAIPPAKGQISPRVFLARKVYEYLKTQSFDIVHVSEWKANCFYALLAKQLGLAFTNTIFCVRCDSPSLWSAMGNNSLINNPEDLLTDYLERKSVEWADIVISPSLHLLHWMEYHGYDLSKDKCYVQPISFFPVSESSLKLGREKSKYLDQVKELVFFGRLEPRKGIQIFCQALTRLEKEGSVGCKVVFLGKTIPKFDAKAYIKSQAKNWSFEWEIITDYNSLEAREYLKSNNRLAVIPSLLDNSPLVIYECLSDRIPLLCSDRGGTPELIYEEDKASVVFPIHPGKFAKHLRKVLDNGVVVARPSFDFQDNVDVYAKWHLAIGNNPNLRLENSNHSQKISLRATPIITPEKPLVSVCIAHFNRPQELSQALDSIKQQTYDNYEVILVDDGSEKPEAIAYLDSLEEDFAKRGWQIIRQENLYLGAVRNTGVCHAKGEYVLLMDDDNCAKPHEIETFVKVAQHSNADVLTCFSDLFKGKDAPKHSSIEYRVTPVGDCVSYGLLDNCYGDSNSLVKRSFFEKIGGFSEDYGVGLCDQEFFSRAVLNEGKLLVVPEALYYYRISETRLRNLHFDLNAGNWRVFRPFATNMPWLSHDIMRLSIGLFKSYHGTKGRVHALQNFTNELSENLELLNTVL